MTVDRWSRAADPGDTDAVAAHVLGFAREHGMHEALTGGAAAVVGSVFDGAVGRLARVGEGTVDVDAATDGDYLTVRIAVRGVDPIDAAWLAMSVAWDVGRVQVDHLPATEDVVVTVELPMTRPRGPAPRVLRPR